jgi:hypothetical protein
MRVATVSVLLWLLFAGEVSAQLVRVGRSGGVSVRAPFVHVEVGPGGETYVRAPFTSVFAPGHGHVVPFEMRPDAPPLPPPPIGLEPASWEALRASGRELQRQLTKLPGGASWGRYLSLPSWVGSTGVGAALSEDDLKQLEELLGRYDLVAQTPTYRRIATLDAFQRCHWQLVGAVEALRRGRFERVPGPGTSEELPPPPGHPARGQ